MLRFAVPSKGNGYDYSVALLERCGLSVSRANPRQYIARLKGIPDTELRLHRPLDIVEKVASGDIDMGITGLDTVRELHDNEDSVLVLLDDLGFWRVELAFAAPQTWIDVSTWADLADLSVEFQERGRPLRIATKFPNLVRQCCRENGINVFHLIHSEGATEAAPGLGYADIIADIVETGGALRDNQLKLVGGPILRSQACLIGSRRSLERHPERDTLVRQLLERIEAQLAGRTLHDVTANIAGTSADEVGRKVTSVIDLAGLQGPTIAPVWNKHNNGTQADGTVWFAVNIAVPRDLLFATVDHLREIGASTVTVTQVQYVFKHSSRAYERLMAQLHPAHT